MEYLSTVFDCRLTEEVSALPANRTPFRQLRGTGKVVAFKRRRPRVKRDHNNLLRDPWYWFASLFVVAVWGGVLLLGWLSTKG